jgi:Tol biopolymer transport system component/predicted Ser/Thr protein kinase
MIGHRLSHYDILAKLGEGGMGVVYKARDTRLDRLVAIKVLNASTTTNAEHKRLFVQEARAASALNHPGLVTIYDIAEENGTDFIAMEFVQGKTLAELIERNRIALNDALNYAIQTASALANAHAAGIIHCDLKPSNIMVTDDGVAKILDFGLAKLVAIKERESAVGATTRTAFPDRGLSETGRVAGTAAYMSPEQAEGKKVDHRSDIFAFGVVLYEMVTATRPFYGDTSMSTLSAVLAKEPTPPTELAKDLPPELERIILRCLRKDPARRLQTMADLVVELEDVKAEAVAKISGPQLPVRATRMFWVRGSIVIFSAVAIAGWLLRSKDAPLPAPARLPLTTFHGDERLATFSPDGNQVAFVWNGEKRDNTDIYVKPVGTGTPLRLTTDPAEDTAPAWSPDGSQIAFMRRQGRQAAIYITPPTPGSEKKLADFRPSNTTSITVVGQLVTITWFPDGKWLAVPAQDDNGMSNGILAIPVSGGEPRTLIWGSRALDYYFPVVSPDGALLAFAGCRSDSNCDVYLMDLGEGSSLNGKPRRVTHQEAGVQGIAWMPDGRSLIYGSRLNGQHLWRVSISGDPPERVELAGTPAVYPAISRTGDKLAFISQGSGDSDLWILKTGAAPERFLSSTLSDTSPQWSPDGQRIVFDSNRSGNGTQIWVGNRDGTNVIPLTEPTGRPQGTPRWSPDSRWIAYDAHGEDAVSHIYVIDAAGGRPRRLTASTGTEQIPSWSRDGKWVYFRSNRTGRAEVWRMPVAGGESQQMTSGGGTSAWESVDGTSLFYTRGGALFARSLSGGPETRVLESVYQWDFFPVRDGIYYIVRPDPTNRYAFELRFLNLATGSSKVLNKFESLLNQGLSVSPDGRVVLYSGVSMLSGDDLMLIQHFR